MNLERHLGPLAVSPELRTIPVRRPLVVDARHYRWDSRNGCGLLARWHGDRKDTRTMNGLVDTTIVAAIVAIFGFIAAARERREHAEKQRRRRQKKTGPRNGSVTP